MTGLRNPDLSSILLIVVFVPNLSDHFTPIVIIVTVSALTISLAAIVSEYLVAVQMLSGVQRVCAATTNAKSILTRSCSAMTWLYCFFFSCSHTAGKTPNAPPATRVRSKTKQLQSLVSLLVYLHGWVRLWLINAHQAQCCAKWCNQFGG